MDRDTHTRGGSGNQTSNDENPQVSETSESEVITSNNSQSMESVAENISDPTDYRHSYGGMFWIPEVEKDYHKAWGKEVLKRTGDTFATFGSAIPDIIGTLTKVLNKDLSGAADSIMSAGSKLTDSFSKGLDTLGLIFSNKYSLGNQILERGWENETSQQPKESKRIQHNR